MLVRTADTILALFDTAIKDARGRVGPWSLDAEALTQSRADFLGSLGANLRP